MVVGVQIHRGGRWMDSNIHSALDILPVRARDFVHTRQLLNGTTTILGRVQKEQQNYLAFTHRTKIPSAQGAYTQEVGPFAIRYLFFANKVELEALPALQEDGSIKRANIPFDLIGEIAHVVLRPYKNVRLAEHLPVRSEVRMEDEFGVFSKITWIGYESAPHVLRMNKVSPYKEDGDRI